jgi:hypothetical protein
MEKERHSERRCSSLGHVDRTVFTMAHIAYTLYRYGDLRFVPFHGIERVLDRKEAKSAKI